MLFSSKHQKFLIKTLKFKNLNKIFSPILIASNKFTSDIKITIDCNLKALYNVNLNFINLIITFNISFIFKTFFANYIANIYATVISNISK